MPVEAGIVDEHDGIWPVLGEVGVGLAAEAKKSRQPGQHGKQAHDRQVGHVRQELAADGLHPRTAETGDSQPGLMTPELGNQIRGVQIAAGLPH